MNNTIQDGLNSWCVYRHIRLDKNEPFYIGIGKDIKRAYQKGYNRRSSWWNKIINKSEYEIELLFENISEEFAKTKEIEFIKLYGRKDLKKGSLCNMTDGGDGSTGQIHSLETKAKRAKHLNGMLNKKHTAISKEIMSSKQTKGNNNLAKKVVDKNTGKIYTCIKDAAEDAGISYSTLCSWLNGSRPYRGNFNYI